MFISHESLESPVNKALVSATYDKEALKRCYEIDEHLGYLTLSLANRIAHISRTRPVPLDRSYAQLANQLSNYQATTVEYIYQWSGADPVYYNGAHSLYYMKQHRKSETERALHLSAPRKGLLGLLGVHARFTPSEMDEFSVADQKIYVDYLDKVKEVSLTDRPAFELIEGFVLPNLNSQLTDELAEHKLHLLTDEANPYQFQVTPVA